MPSTESAGTEIHWEEIGPADGHAVLLVHGFGSNRAENWLNAGWQAPLSEAGFRGILVDLRGHGESGRPIGADNYRPEMFLGDLTAVLDATGVGRAHYLGYSFGSRLGWDFARTHPDRVHRLVLGGFSVGSPMADFDVAAARDLVQNGAEIEHQLTASLMQMSALVPGNDLPRLIDVVEGVRGAGLPSVIDDTPPQAPTLIVTGERDEIATGAGAFAESIGAEYLELKARSHASAITARGFKAAAMDWFGG